MLKREMYLTKIRPFYHEDLIKVLVGVRRSGKSELLKQIRDEIMSIGVKKDHIIYLNFEIRENNPLKDPDMLNDYVRKQIKDEKKYYLFFDEIHLVRDFEQIINSFKASLNCSIFVTGSNAQLLSGEYATLLSGRFVHFQVQPFTFREMIEYQKQMGKDVDEKEAFWDYLRWGGFPQRFAFKNDSEIRIYLKDIYDTIALNDIIKRSEIRRVNLLTHLIEYLVDNTSQIFSAESIGNFLRSEGRIETSPETIYDYVSKIESSYIVSPAKRYDIRGKKILATLEKYYTVDMGLINVRRDRAPTNLGPIFETIVYNELIARGYEVFLGKTSVGEIDFIAFRDGERKYIQVAYKLSDDEVIQREFGAFKEIDDNYPKYVISADEVDYSRDGIKHINMVEFLLSEEL